MISIRQPHMTDEPQIWGKPLSANAASPGARDPLLLAVRVTLLKLVDGLEHDLTASKEREEVLVGAVVAGA